MKERLTDTMIRRWKLQSGQQVDVFDTVVRGLVLRLSYGGTRTFRVRYKNEDKKWRTYKLGEWDPETFNIEAARDAAKKFDYEARILVPRRVAEAAAAATLAAEAERLQSKGDLAAHATFAEVVEVYLEKRASKMRSYKEIARCLRTLAVPELGHKQLVQIDTADVQAMKLKVKGERQSEIVAAMVRAVARWFERKGYKRGYLCPIRLYSNDDVEREVGRDRTLKPDELRIVWRAATEMGGQFGAIVKLLVLTAQRRQCLVTACWSDFEGDVWTIRKESRRKGTAQILRLPPLAMEILAGLPRVRNCPFVFGVEHNGEYKPFNSFSKSNSKLKALIKEKFERWTLHDLRRTSRSLMGDIEGISPDVAEAILGHKLVGVERIYNRAEMLARKTKALLLLAEQISQIVKEPPPGTQLAKTDDNVVPIRRSRRS